MVSNEKFSVLIVDDEKSNLIVLNDILRNQYTIYIAKDGENAIRMAKERIPDLILLDIIMPDISGFDVLTEIKQIDETKSIPVIFITGLDNVEDEEKGFELGAVDYITKPFHRSIVKARVLTHFKIIEQMRTIQHMGMMDALTNIPNRRYFNEVFNKEWAKAIAEKKPISLLIIDIDKFKVYNDTYGHPQGDELLKAVGNTFKQCTEGTGGFAARWGGEEFTILLPAMEIDNAARIAEKIRITVSGLRIPNSDGAITQTTVSIGVNSIIPIETDKISQFVSDADEALYSAKEAGRNRILKAL